MDKVLRPQMLQIMENQRAIMLALSQLLPSANVVQPLLEECIRQSNGWDGVVRLSDQLQAVGARS